MGQCKRMGHFGGKTFLYQPRHWSITLQWNVKLEKILPHICISKSFVSFAYPVFHRFSLHSYLASFQTELTNTNAHFVFPYLIWFVKSLFHSKIFCSSPSVLGCSNCISLYYYLQCQRTSLNFQVYFLYRLEEQSSAVKQQWIFNKVILFVSAGYLPLYLSLHIKLCPLFPVFDRKTCTWCTTGFKITTMGE